MSVRAINAIVGPASAAGPNPAPYDPPGRVSNAGYTNSLARPPRGCHDPLPLPPRRPRAGPRPGGPRRRPRPGRAGPRPRHQGAARQGSGLFQPQEHRRIGHARLQDQRRQGRGDLQLHAADPLPPRLPERAGRRTRPQGDQLLRLESVRRAARHPVGVVARGRLGVAVRRLARPHHRRGQVRRPLALPGRVLEVLCLDAGPEEPRQVHHRRRGRLGGRPQEARHRRLRDGQGSEGRLSEERPVRRVGRRKERMDGPGVPRLRRQPRRCRGGGDAQEPRRPRTGLGRPQPRHRRLLGRCQPRPRLRPDQHLGPGRRGGLVGRQQEVPGTHLRRQGDPQLAGEGLRRRAVPRPRLDPRDLRQRHPQFHARFERRGLSEVVRGRREYQTRWRQDRARGRWQAGLRHGAVAIAVHPDASGRLGRRRGRRRSQHRRRQDVEGRRSQGFRCRRQGQDFSPRPHRRQRIVEGYRARRPRSRTTRSPCRCSRRARTK